MLLLSKFLRGGVFLFCFLFFCFFVFSFEEKKKNIKH
jgi:hypothetical protein